jgi:hypothetical protein
VPSDDSKLRREPSAIRPDSPSSSVDSSSCTSAAGLRQPHGDKSTEEAKPCVGDGNTSEAAAPSASSQQPPNPQLLAHQGTDSIGKSPGEIAFFKLLHAEYKKASHFFDKAQQEFTIREERVSEGMEIMKQPNSIMVNEKWSLLAKSIYRLYKDLLLLETFAIMTYCSFSKILKKHDKVTGYDTRNAFMANIVNKANFTRYPKVMEMIGRCERLYGEVSDQLLREGKEGLYEDERLFINMIHRLNEQALDSAEGEGAAQKEAPRRPVVQISMPPLGKESRESLSLRSLVEDNDKKSAAAQVSEGQAAFDEDDSDDGHGDGEAATVLPKSSEESAKKTVSFKSPGKRDAKQDEAAKKTKRQRNA